MKTKKILVKYSSGSDQLRTVTDLYTGMPRVFSVPSAAKPMDIVRHLHSLGVANGAVRYKFIDVPQPKNKQ